MRKSQLLIALFVLLSALGLRAASGQAEQRSYLPLVATDISSITVLVATDTTMVTCYAIPNTTRIIVTYIDRLHGNRLHVTEDMGDLLVELDMPPGLGGLTADSTAPAFVVPGDKQANGCIVVVGNTMKLYVTTRDENDPTGPFKLKRWDTPIPPPPNP